MSHACSDILLRQDPLLPAAAAAPQAAQFGTRTQSATIGNYLSNWIHKDRVFPRVFRRSLLWVDILNPELDGSSDMVTEFEVLERAALAVAIGVSPSQEAPSLIRHSILKKLEMDEQAHLVYTRAMDNLRRISKPEFYQVAPGVWESQWRDGLDSSRVLIPGLFSKLKLRGQPVMLPLSDDKLIVTGVSNRVGLKYLADAQSEWFHHTGLADNESLGGWALIEERGKLVPFAPAGGDALFMSFRTMSVVTTAAEAACMASLFSLRLGLPTPRMRFRDNARNHNRYAYTTWTLPDPADVGTNAAPVDELIVPETAWVEIADHQGKVLASAPFKRVMDIMKNKMTTLTCGPNVYRVAFPTPDEIFRIGCVRKP